MAQAAAWCHVGEWVTPRNHRHRLLQMAFRRLADWKYLKERYSSSLHTALDNRKLTLKSVLTVTALGLLAGLIGNQFLPFGSGWARLLEEQARKMMFLHFWRPLENTCG